VSPAEVGTTSAKSYFCPLALLCFVVIMSGFDQFAAHTSESIWPLDMQMNDLANLESLIFSESELVNLDENFETEIFKIQFHHSISGLIQKLFDRYRFKQRTVTLSDRARLEEFPSR
jgi:hypothetical protein